MANVLLAKETIPQLHIAINYLTLEHAIESYNVQRYSVQLDFDCWRVNITSPFDGALHFELSDRGVVIDSVLTDQVKLARPIKRLVQSLFGKVMLESFKKEWDGFSLTELFSLTENGVQKI